MAKLQVIQGRVWKFGDNITTTDITPKEMFRGKSYALKDIAFAGLRPDWKDKVKPGDCIVGGSNFAYGSSRTSANDVMKELGIGCIVADSFARIFYRNSIAIGFPSFACPGVSAIFGEGDELALDCASGLVRNLTTGRSLQGKPYTQQLVEILENGGLMPLIVDRVRKHELSGKAATTNPS
jgi:3-isopropylmalate/(R)-2-methylmalate dehydratase small subunit